MEADTNFAANHDKTPGKLFKCKYCCKLFSIKSNCNRHERSCHKNLRSNIKFCCPNCESSYSRQDYLKSHVKSCTISISETSTETSHLLHVQTKKKPPCLVQDFETMEAHTKFEANNDKNPGKVFKCKYCCKPFSIRGNCNRHERSCHTNLKPKTKFCCPNCKSSYSTQDCLKVHLKSCTSRSQDPKFFQNSPLNPPSICETSTETSNLVHVQTKRKNPCFVPGCNLAFFRKISLIEHLQSAHESEISIKTIVKDFSSFQEFQEWKEAEEERTFSYFSQRTSGKNSAYCHYYCQHDGSQKLHFDKKTSRCNKKGRVKVGHCCIAKIKVTKNEDGSVHVEYFPTHSHKTKPQDFVHHPLKRKISEFIDKLIAEQVSPTKGFNKIPNIYDENNADDIKSDKMNFVTKKRIRERVRRQCNAKGLDKDDAKAVYLLAKAMIEREKSHSLQNRENSCKLVEDLDCNLLTNRTEMVNTKNENAPNEKLSEESANSRRLKARIGKHLTILKKFHKTAESSPLNLHMLAHVESELSNIVLLVG